MGHAQDWLLFEDNIGESLSIDETCLSSGEVYTFLTNKAGKGRKGTLVAVVKGTKAEDVIQVLKKIDQSKRKTVKEITLDLSSSMMRIARAVFPKALITNDRFHVQKLYYDALDDMRIAYRWMARDKENEEIKEAKSKGKEYIPFRYSNGDTRKQLLARAKFILTKHKTKWTETQKDRAQIIFEHYPTLKKAYDLAMKLIDIYNIKSIKDAARLKLAKWFNEVEKLGVDNFYTVIDTFKNHYDTILNFFVNRATNANAESFNAKVKAFRAQFRGVTDIPFFLYRLMKYTFSTCRKRKIPCKSKTYKGFVVPRPGLEPGWVAPLVFETSASTYSAIWALFRVQRYGVFSNVPNILQKSCSGREFEQNDFLHTGITYRNSLT